MSHNGLHFQSYSTYPMVAESPWAAACIGFRPHPNMAHLNLSLGAYNAATRCEAWWKTSRSDIQNGVIHTMYICDSPISRPVMLS
jgi:hypothetical protein